MTTTSGPHSPKARLAHLYSGMRNKTTEPTSFATGVLIIVIAIAAILIGLAGLPDMKPNVKGIIGFTLVGYGPSGNIDNLFTGLAEQLGVMFIIAMFLERSLEVYVKVWRLPIREALEWCVSELTTECDATNVNAKADLVEKIAEARVTLERYRTRTRHITLLTGVSVSMALVLVGPRAMDAIFDLADGAGLFQTAMVNSIDILITAGLIAGGTAVIHPMLTASSTFFIASTKALKA